MQHALENNNNIYYVGFSKWVLQYLPGAIGCNFQKYVPLVISPADFSLCISLLVFTEFVGNTLSLVPWFANLPGLKALSWRKLGHETSYCLSHDHSLLLLF